MTWVEKVDDYVIKYSKKTSSSAPTTAITINRTEIEALRNLKSQGSITPRQYEKITYDNPKELFGL